MARAALLLTFVLVVAASAVAQPPPIDEEALAEVQRRGQLLYAYDRSAALATVVVMDLVNEGRLQSELIPAYVAVPTAAGWRVGFGSLSEADDEFLVAVEVSLNDGLQVSDVHLFDEPVARRSAYRDAALAISAAIDHVEFDDLPYNFSVIPDGDALLVYVIPAQTEPGFFPLGGDTRLRFDPAARAIVDETQLHVGLQQLASEVEGELVTGTLSIATGPLPAETAVRLAMFRRPAIPHYVVAGEWVFAIDRTGSIQPIPAVEFGLD